MSDTTDSILAAVIDATKKLSKLPPPKDLYVSSRDYEQLKIHTARLTPSQRIHAWALYRYALRRERLGHGAPVAETIIEAARKAFPGEVVYERPASSPTMRVYLGPVTALVPRWEGWKW